MKGLKAYKNIKLVWNADDFQLKDIIELINKGLETSDSFYSKMTWDPDKNWYDDVVVNAKDVELDPVISVDGSDDTMILQVNIKHVENSLGESCTCVTTKPYGCPVHSPIKEK